MSQVVRGEVDAEGSRRPLVVLFLAAVASSLCGFCLHPQGFVLAIGLGVVILVGVGWPRVVVAGLRGSLAFDRPRVREGGPVTVRVELDNRPPWRAWGLAVRPGLVQDQGTCCERFSSLSQP